MDFARNTEAARRLTVWTETVFNIVEGIQTQCSEILTATLPPDQLFNVDQATRKQLFSVAQHHLAEFSYLDGAGLIFQRQLVAQQSPALEWWVRDGDTVARQEFVNDPRSPLFYDYEQLEWFRGGFGAEARTIAGPYIDHLGVNDYITTWTVPLVVHGSTVGVVGVDMKIATLEKVLLPLLMKASERRAAFVNATGQVIVSTIGPYPSGTLVETAPDGYDLFPLGVENLDLNILVQTH